MYIYIYIFICLLIYAGHKQKQMCSLSLRGRRHIVPHGELKIQLQLINSELRRNCAPPRLRAIKITCKLRYPNHSSFLLKPNKAFLD